MLSNDRCILALVDVQGKLANLMHGKDELFANLVKLVRGVQALDIPIIWVEQNPAGLGPTIPELAELLTDQSPIEKMSFSCCLNDEFIETLQGMDRDQILIAGIEAHICIYQTTMNLLEAEYDVEVVTDCVSSRTAENKQLALKKLIDAGAGITGVEMALFEMLGIAEGDKFKQVLKIVK